MTQILTNTSTEEITLEDLFDMIMGTIEPELTSANISELDEIYKDETEEENKQRLKRYRNAFIQCNKTWSECMTHWDSALRIQALKAGKTLQKQDKHA